MTAPAGTPRYIRGVPHPLPEGEEVLWQGAPDARAVAVHVFHRWALAGYFAAMLAVWALFDAGTSRDQFLAKGAMLGAAVLFVLGLVEVLARVVARTTWYAITNRRVVLRIGMVLPMSINVPFTILASAGVGRFRDGTGQVVLRLVRGQRIAWIALWPHCRPFAFTQPEPVLRGLRDPDAVGSLLARAVAASGVEVVGGDRGAADRHPAAPTDQPATARTLGTAAPVRA